MDRIRQLEADRDALRKQLSAMLDASAKDKRALSDEEREQADALTGDLGRVEATLKLERDRADYDRQSAQPIQTPDEPAAEPAGQAAAKMKPEKVSWAGFGQFLRAVAKMGSPGGTADPTLFPKAAPSGLNTGILSEGGVFVRQEYSTALLGRAMETAQLAPRCWSVPVGDGFDGVEMPIIEETSRATGSRWGGVQVYRRNEGETVTATKPKFGRFDLRLEDLMGICYATDRALQDATALGEIISRAFASEFAFKVDDEIIRGTGVGQAEGILVTPSLVTVAKESGQTAKTIVSTNIIKMRARLRPRNRPNAIWLINNDCEPQLLTMNIAVGVAGVPVWMPANGLAASPYDTLFGRPVVPIEQCETLGTVGDIIAADFGEYMLISKGGIVGAESIHVRFLYGENTFRFTWRVSGAPTWKAPLTPYKGTDTISPFVALATRA